MSTDDLINCEICGRPLVPRIEGQSSGMYCPSCDRWAVVTTYSYTPPIQQDRTNYLVFIAASDFHNKVHVQAVAEVAAVNFLQAREILRRERPQIYAGKAEDIVRVRDALTATGISIEIEPPFPW